MATAQSSCDIGIIIALKEEFREFRDLFPGILTPMSDSDTGAVFFRFEFSRNMMKKPYSCVVAMIGRMGHTKAALMTKTMINAYHPKTIVNMGIAGAIDDDIKLCDVVVATQINSYMERAKATRGRSIEDFVLTSSPESYRATEAIIHRIQNLEFSHPTVFHHWVYQAEEYLKSNSSEQQREQLQQQLLLRVPVEVFEGHLASGPTVSATRAFGRWLKRSDRAYLAVEMESAGVMAAIHDSIEGSKTLVIRGISDFGDERKSKLDRLQSGGFRRIAMHNSVQFLWALLEAESLPFAEQPQNSRAKRVSFRSEAITVGAGSQKRLKSEVMPDSIGMGQSLDLESLRKEISARIEALGIDRHDYARFLYLSLLGQPFEAHPKNNRIFDNRLLARQLVVPVKHASGLYELNGVHPANKAILDLLGNLSQAELKGHNQGTHLELLKGSSYWNEHLGLKVD